jgi:arylsulfatase A-like enzyme
MKLTLTLTTALLFASLTALPAVAGPNPPNVILVLTDDQGHGELGCHGNPHLKTPNLDRLHGESVRFTDFHVSPNCTPTRAAIMTGYNPVRVGAWSTAFGLSMLREGVPTMADVFAASGYRTALFGKWHLGDNYPFHPEDRGFQEVLRHGGGGVGQTPDYWGNDYFDDTYFRNGHPEKHTGYCTDVWFGEAMKFITANRERPFFLYLPTNAPHGPLFVAEEYAAPYRGNPAVVSANFYGMIANLDENMGRLMDKLQALGLAENTILIFMTDNGTGSGVKTDKEEKVTQGYNSGMRGKKGSYYEGGHRVPFFIRWPTGGLGGGRDIGSLATHMDLLPTFIDLCGLKRPEAAKFDGISLAPVLRGEAKTTPERSVLIRIPRARDKTGERAGVVMSEHWRLVGGTMLFDIHADPGQTKDIAAGHPDIVQRLQSVHDKQWAEVFPNPEDFSRIVVGHEAENPVRLTGFDWHSNKAPWNQPAIRYGVEANGHWLVRVERAGRYEVALRRWPEEVKQPITAALPKSTGALPGKAIAATHARLQIGDFDQTQPIPTDAEEVVFQVELKAGPTQVETWLLDEKSSTSRGAYYVRVERKAKP